MVNCCEDQASDLQSDQRDNENSREEEESVLCETVLISERDFVSLNR